MEIRIGRSTAKVLRVLLFPIVVLYRLFRRLRPLKKPEYHSTVTDPIQAPGSLPIVIAVWASWSTVWTVVTEKIILQLQREFAGRCEFAFVEGESKEVREEYGAKILPVVIVRANGREIERFVNLTKEEPVRRVLEKVCGAGVRVPADQVE